MVKKRRTTKGAPQKYDEWIPEYTKKTGKLTKRSEKQLEEIRAQVFGERLADTELAELVEVAGFAGLVAMFYYGVNPALYKLFEVAMDAVGSVAETYTETIEWITKDLESHFDVITIKAESQAKADGLIKDWGAKAQEITQERIDHLKQKIRTWQRQVDRGDLSDNYRRILEHRIETESGRLAEWEDKFASGKLTKPEAKWVKAKANAYNLMLSLGEAYALTTFLRNYDFHDLRQDTKLL